MTPEFIATEISKGVVFSKIWQVFVRICLLPISDVDWLIQKFVPFFNLSSPATTKTMEEGWL